MSLKCVKGGVLSITKFPAGESKVVFTEGENYQTKKIVMDWESNDDLFNLALAVDAIRRVSSSKIHLLIPYIPYGRQDRVNSIGESLSIKVVADFINSLNIDTVTSLDAHSDVTLALFNNIEHKESYEIAQWFGIDFSSVVLVSPDAGAMKKVGKLADSTGAPMVVATKRRNTETGAITETQVSTEHIGSKDFLIVDDLCEGGYTFTELAKALKPKTNGRVLLYVTHGIFSKGYKVFDNLIDHIYTYNLMGKDDNMVSFIHSKEHYNDI